MLEEELVRRFPLTNFKTFYGDWFNTNNLKFVGYEVPLIWDSKGRHQVTDILFETEDGKKSVVIEAKTKATMHVLPQILLYRNTLSKTHDDVTSFIICEHISSDLYDFLNIVGAELQLYRLVYHEDEQRWVLVEDGRY